MGEIAPQWQNRLPSLRPCLTACGLPQSPDMRQQAPFNKHNVPPGAGILGMPKGKPVFTKKTQLDNKTYISICMKKALKKFWYAFLVPPVIILPGLYWTGALIWLVVAALVITILYLLFWYVQFYGMAMLPQGKPLFERQLYAITPDYLGIMKKETDPQGMMIPWDKIETVERTADSFIFHLTLAHIVIIPFNVFNSQQDQNYTESILRRRSLLPAREEKV